MSHETIPSTWMTTYVLMLLQTEKYCGYMCSAGSLGYHALKEMLQNGMPGCILLSESEDLRTVGATTDNEDDDGRGGSTPFVLLTRDDPNTMVNELDDMSTIDGDSTTEDEDEDEQESRGEGEDALMGEVDSVTIIQVVFPIVC